MPYQLVNLNTARAHQVTPAFRIPPVNGEDSIYQRHFGPRETLGYVSGFQPLDRPPTGTEVQELSKNIHDLVDSVENMEALIVEGQQHLEEQLNEEEPWQHGTFWETSRSKPPGSFTLGTEAQEFSQNIHSLVGVMKDFEDLLLEERELREEHLKSKEYEEEDQHENEYEPEEEEEYEDEHWEDEHEPEEEEEYEDEHWEDKHEPEEEEEYENEHWEDDHEPEEEEEYEDEHWEDDHEPEEEEEYEDEHWEDEHEPEEEDTHRAKRGLSHVKTQKALLARQWSSRGRSSHTSTSNVTHTRTPKMNLRRK